MISSTLSPSRSILIVDDNIDIVLLLCQIATSDGMTATGISSGEQFLSCLESEKFDVIVLDIGLGNYDGLDLAKQIKADGKNRSSRIVLLSGRQVEEQVFKDSSADSFLLKPFGLQEFSDSIRI